MDVDKLMKALDDESNETLLNFTTEKLREMNLKILNELHLSKKYTQELMRKLKDYKYRKKIILYDTPWNTINNILHIQSNKIYRFDYLCFYQIYNTYCNHYNYNDIKTIIKSYNRFSNAESAIQLIKRVHNMTKEEVEYYTSVNTELNNLTVINIYCTSDPIVIYDLMYLFR